MNAKVKGILAVAILSTTMIGTAVATGYSRKINVVMNSINIQVNGETMKQDNILYNGTTYVSVRSAGELLNKEVNWDPKTRTASIGENNNPEPYLPPLIGDSRDDELKVSKGGSFENPIGIPSTATLIESTPEQRWHKYNYRFNLPGGGFIENIIFNGNNDVNAIVTGYDNSKNGFMCYVYPDGRIGYRHFGSAKAPDFTSEDNKIIRYEGRMFLGFYGY